MTKQKAIEAEKQKAQQSEDEKQKAIEAAQQEIAAEKRKAQKSEDEKQKAIEALSTLSVMLAQEKEYCNYSLLSLNQNGLGNHLFYYEKHYMLFVLFLTKLNICYI